MDAPDRTLLNRGADLVIDVPHPAFEPANVVAQITGYRARRGRLIQPLPFRAEHLEQLPAPRDQGAERLRGGIRDRARRRADARAEPREQRRINRIGLGGAADRLREGAHLARIDDRDGEADRRTLRH